MNTNSRMRMRWPIFICFLAACCVFCLYQNPSYAQSDKQLYDKSLQASQKGNFDIAFSYLHMLLYQFPQSPFYTDALFSSAEYYFDLKDYGNAEACLNELVENFPTSKAIPFALTYLIKIAEIENDLRKAEKVKKALIGIEQLSLLFRDYKELVYLSAFSRNYKVLFFIDKIEIYVNDELFERIAF